MTSDLAALRTAVRLSPRDATARSVLADCLDDHGDPLGAALQRVLAFPDDDARRLEYAAVCERLGDADRAEFVRVQVELAKPIECKGWGCRNCSSPAVASPPYSPEECGCRFKKHTELLVGRAYRLLDSDSGRETGLHKNWLAWSGLAGTGILIGRMWNERMEYRRGFVDWIACPGDWWVRNADAITEAHPVRRVRLTTTPPYTSRDDPAARRQRWWFSGREDHVYFVAEREIALAGGYRHAAEVGRHAMLCLLRLNWPQIEFEVPPAFAAHRILHDHAEREALAEASRVDTIIRGVADQYGIADPEAAARDRRLVRVMADDRPTWSVVCGCGTDWLALGDIATDILDRVTLRTVTLTAHEYAWDDGRVRYTVHHGRCECGRVYVSVRRWYDLEGP